MQGTSCKCRFIPCKDNDDPYSTQAVGAYVEESCGCRFYSCKDEVASYSASAASSRNSSDVQMSLERSGKYDLPFGPHPGASRPPIDGIPPNNSTSNNNGMIDSNPPSDLPGRSSQQSQAPRSGPMRLLDHDPLDSRFQQHRQNEIQRLLAAAREQLRHVEAWDNYLQYTYQYPLPEIQFEELLARSAVGSSSRSSSGSDEPRAYRRTDGEYGPGYVYPRIPDHHRVPRRFRPDGYTLGSESTSYCSCTRGLSACTTCMGSEPSASSFSISSRESRSCSNHSCRHRCCCYPKLKHNRPCDNGKRFGDWPTRSSTDVSSTVGNTGSTASDTDYTDSRRTSDYIYYADRHRDSYYRGFPRSYPRRRTSLHDNPQWYSPHSDQIISDSGYCHGSSLGLRPLALRSINPYANERHHVYDTFPQRHSSNVIARPDTARGVMLGAVWTLAGLGAFAAVTPDVRRGLGVLGGLMFFFAVNSALW